MPPHTAKTPSSAASILPPSWPAPIATHLGIFYGPNLTNDKATGLGNWTDAQIVKAMKTGERPDGRILAPAMPWQDFAGMTEADLNAVVAYLRALPVVVNKVPGPFGPGEPATSFVMKVVPPPG